VILVDIDHPLQILLEPYTYHSQIPGKEIRSKLIEAFNLWLNVPEDDLEVIKRIVRMLHNASLLSVGFCSSSIEPRSRKLMVRLCVFFCRMDDVEDSSELRRGIPVAHKIYGVPQTINTANYVYFLAMQELYRFRASRKVKDAEQGRKEDDNLDEVITGTSCSQPESQAAT